LVVSDFRKLKVWRKSHALALNVRRVSARIRGLDNASLRNQIVRAAASIPTNIVEGSGQQSRKDFARFLSIALNSTSELEYHLIFARDVRAISENDFRSLSDQAIETRKMLLGLRSRVISTPLLSRSSVPTS
jgi:four helix bundle protein